MDNINDNNNCIICLDNIKETDTDYIEYNHCGKYYIHLSCYNDINNEQIPKNECIICRKKIKKNEYFGNIESNNAYIQININDEELNTCNNNYYRLTKFALTTFILFDVCFIFNILNKFY